MNARITTTMADAISAAHPEGTYDIEVMPIADAISQRNCSTLQVQPPGKVLHGRVSVRVSCIAPRPWSFYAQARIHLLLPAIVATRTINRGERISAADLTTRPMPAGHSRNTALTDPQDAIGLTARVTIARDKVISSRQLAVPVAVSRGERVRIQAASGRVQINAYGIAMRDGRVGEQIPVRNVSSERTIQPWVVGPGVVSTRPR